MLSNLRRHYVKRFVTKNIRSWKTKTFFFKNCLLHIFRKLIIITCTWQFLGSNRCLSYWRYGWWYVYDIQWWCIWFTDGNTDYQPSTISYPWYAWNLRQACCCQWQGRLKITYVQFTIWITYIWSNKLFSVIFYFFNIIIQNNWSWKCLDFLIRKPFSDWSFCDFRKLN